MTKKYNKKHDPYYEREKKKYDNPLPSREFILEFLEEMDVPCSPGQMLSGLGLKKEQLEGLNRRLRAMDRDGPITLQSQRLLWSIEQVGVNNRAG